MKLLVLSSGLETGKKSDGYVGQKLVSRDGNGCVNELIFNFFYTKF